MTEQPQPRLPVGQLPCKAPITLDHLGFGTAISEWLVGRAFERLDVFVDPDSSWAQSVLIKFTGPDAISILIQDKPGEQGLSLRVIGGRHAPAVRYLDEAEVADLLDARRRGSRPDPGAGVAAVQLEVPGPEDPPTPEAPAAIQPETTTDGEAPR